MAKVLGRRPVLNSDGKYYMCEQASDYVYRIEPDADPNVDGHETEEACIWSYLEYLVSQGTREQLKPIDTNITPTIPGVGDIPPVPATHYLKLQHGQVFFINEEHFDEEAIVRSLKENPRGIIF